MLKHKSHRLLRLGLLLLLIMGSNVLSHRGVAQQLFTLDAASFRQRNGLVYLEVYFMIQRDRLRHVQAANGYEAQYRISLELHSPDTLLSTTSWEMMDRALQLEDITPRQKLPDIVVYNLFPGEYEIKGFVTDLNQNITDVRSEALTLNSFPEAELTISDIELATKLQKGQEGSKFFKNGFLVIPNPERVYGTSLPMLYYYAEIYNLMPTEGEFSVDRLILNNAQEEVKRLPLKRHNKVGTSAVEVDGFSVVSLHSGSYYLKLVVEDQDAEAKASAQTKFFVYRPADFAEPPSVAGRTGPTPDELEFGSYNEEELDEAIEELKYLISDSELRSAGKLNTEGKRQFLIRFWVELDPDPTTEINEFRITFKERKEYADQKYGIFGRPGWKAPQGRVYILYGQPDDVEYHPHDLDTRSYEIWHYDSIEGGVEFVFVDRNNFGDYRLVHSTKKGELYRPNWYEEEALVRKP